MLLLGSKLGSFATETNLTVPLSAYGTNIFLAIVLLTAAICKLIKFNASLMSDYYWVRSVSCPKVFKELFDVVVCVWSCNELVIIDSSARKGMNLEKFIKCN